MSKLGRAPGDGDSPHPCSDDSESPHLSRIRQKLYQRIPCPASFPSQAHRPLGKERPGGTGQRDEDREPEGSQNLLKVILEVEK